MSPHRDLRSLCPEAQKILSLGRGFTYSFLRVLNTNQPHGEAEQRYIAKPEGVFVSNSNDGQLVGVSQ